MKPVIIIAIIVSSITIFSILPDAEAKTWKVHIIDMPKQWQSQFGHLYDEGTKYWEEQIPGTYFTEIAYREKADFAIQWSSKFEGDRLGYYTTDVDNDFGIPFIAITIGYMDDDESIKWQDRKFNLVDPEYAKLITIHELGHAIGLDHSKNPDDIMYPSIYNYDLWLSQKQSAVLETQIVTSTVEPTKNIELELINSIYQKISNVLSNTDYSLDEPTVFSFDDDSIKTGYVIHNSDGESFGVVNIWSENNVVNRLEIATSHFNDFDSTAIATIALAGMIKGVMDTNEYDVEDFIEIIHTLINEGQNVHGIIVGSAHPKKLKYAVELKGIINTLGLEDDITMTGYRADLKEIMSISSIVFSLSTEPEAFGRTTIEALSLGTPVIGYNHGGVKEQLEQLFPDGAIPLGQLDVVIEKIKEWSTLNPLPTGNKTFTLESMCLNCFELYSSF